MKYSFENQMTDPNRSSEGDKFMSDYQITCCSTVDLTAERLREREIAWACFHLSVGEDTYTDDFGQSIATKEIYRRMLAGEETKTSQVSIGEYEELFRPFLEAGKDILHLALSSGISGTVNSARIAAEDLAAEYPDRKIFVVDTLCASSGYGMFAEMAADLRDAGKSIEEVRDFLLAERTHIQHWFFTSDLTFFIRGGRVSRTAGFIGKVMNICPLLDVNRQGGLLPREKVRTKKAVIRRTVEIMKSLAENGTAYSGRCYISHSECPEDAEAVRGLVEKTFPGLQGKVQIFPIGPTISCHTGPGTVALFYVGKERENG
jgi:DegV family protein with EDD domain